MKVIGTSFIEGYITHYININVSSTRKYISK